jgi:ribosomal protein S18 acetylase RimI-like enzyme
MRQQSNLRLQHALPVPVPVLQVWTVIWFILAASSWVLVPVVEGFPVVSRQTNNAAGVDVRIHIHIRTVETNEDWNALADIRFDEWIKKDGGTTSRQAFQLATRDIYKEERPNSLLLLATTTTTQQEERGAAPDDDDDDNNNKGFKKKDKGFKKKDKGFKKTNKKVDAATNNVVVVVGAAEMGPYELEEAISKDAPISALYVTDVVTRSSFRRQGVARMLLQGMEEHAANVMGVTHLVLNVAHDNTSAIRFYETLGYHALSTDTMQHLDVAKLEDAAGTKGQLLLEKALVDDTIL